MKHLLFILFTLILLTACSDDSPVTTPEPNKPPVIDRIVLPASVEANQTVTLQVLARDTDTDKLTIIWEASEGTVDKTVWTAPNRATQVVVSVHVSDRTNPTVTLTKNVTVIKPSQPVEPPPTEIQPPTPTPEPPTPQPQPTPEPPLPEPKPDPIKAFQPGIQPGVGIAAIRVGATLAEVEAIHGKSEFRGEGVFRYEALGISFAMTNNRVSTILLVADKLNLKTEGGLGIGSRRADVEREFGREERVSVIEGRLVFWHSAKGISFTYNQNDRVDRIIVFKPIR